MWEFIPPYFVVILKKQSACGKRETTLSENALSKEWVQWTTQKQNKNQPC